MQMDIAAILLGSIGVVLLGAFAVLVRQLRKEPVDDSPPREGATVNDAASQAEQRQVDRHREARDDRADAAQQTADLTDPNARREALARLGRNGRHSQR